MTTITASDDESHESSPSALEKKQFSTFLKGWKKQSALNDEEISQKIKGDQKAELLWQKYVSAS